MSPFAGCFHFRLLEGSKEREQQRPMCVESKRLSPPSNFRGESESRRELLLSWGWDRQSLPRWGKGADAMN